VEKKGPPSLSVKEPPAVKPVSEFVDRTAYTFEGPEIDGMVHRIMLTIDREMKHSDIERYAKVKVQQILEPLQGFEVIKNQQITIQGGNPAFDFVVKWTIDKEKAQKFRKYVFVIHDNRGFTFHIDFTRQSYRMINKLFKKLIEGFLPGTYVVKQAEPAYEYHSPYR
jgi:hypothetical protein